MKNLKYRINNRRKNRYDKFNTKFYNKVQKGFIKLSKNKKNYMIINSNLSIFENKSKIIKKPYSICCHISEYSYNGSGLINT